jgi:hypothetical protein
MPLDIIDEIRPRKEERSTLREIVSYIVGLASLIALLVAATWPTKANAEPLITRHDKDYVRLMDGPCVAPKVVQMFVDGGAMKHLPAFKALAADINGEHLAGCWRTSLEPEGFYILFFEDRDPLVLPQEMFVVEAV